ncbi:unnamed protein product, partial [Iphiclides podalirius]
MAFGKAPSVRGFTQLPTQWGVGRGDGGMGINETQKSKKPPTAFGKAAGRALIHATAVGRCGGRQRWRGGGGDATKPSAPGDIARATTPRRPTPRDRRKTRHLAAAVPQFGAAGRRR